MIFTVTTLPCCLLTTSATLVNFSWFIQFTSPNLLIQSPAFSPASSAGPPSSTLFTLANGVSTSVLSLAAVASCCRDELAETAVEGAGGLAARDAWCEAWCS